MSPKKPRPNQQGRQLEIRMGATMLSNCAASRIVMLFLSNFALYLDSNRASTQSSLWQESFVITPRSEDYSQWYQDVISAAQMVDQSPVKGCMVNLFTSHPICTVLANR